MSEKKSWFIWVLRDMMRKLSLLIPSTLVSSLSQMKLLCGLIASVMGTSFFHPCTVYDSIFNFLFWWSTTIYGFWEVISRLQCTLVSKPHVGSWWNSDEILFSWEISSFVLHFTVDLFLNAEVLILTGPQACLVAFVWNHPIIFLALLPVMTGGVDVVLSAQQARACR